MSEGHSAAGRSIIERLWEQAVAQYDNLNELHDATGGVTVDNLVDGWDHTEEAETALKYLQTQGKLLGLCYSIALMLNPYELDIDGVKAQVREQWAAEYGDEDEEEEEE